MNADCIVTSRTASSLTISWTGSSEYMDKSASGRPMYVVYRTGSDWGDDVVVDTTYNTFLTMNNLSASTTYVLTVTEYNSIGTQTGLDTCYATTLTGNVNGLDKCYANTLTGNFSRLNTCYATTLTDNMTTLT